MTTRFRSSSSLLALLRPVPDLPPESEAWHAVVDGLTQALVASLERFQRRVPSLTPVQAAVAVANVSALVLLEAGDAEEDVQALREHADEVVTGHLADEALRRQLEAAGRN